MANFRSAPYRKIRRCDLYSGHRFEDQENTPGPVMRLLTDSLPFRSWSGTGAAFRHSAEARVPGVGLRQVLLIVVCLITALLVAPASAFSQDTPKKLLAIVDYISSDYKNAVQDGKILNQNEYQEQLEFSRRSLELLEELQKSGGDRADVEPEIKTLVSHIQAKAAPKVVADTANGIEQKIMAAYHIV